MQKPVFRLALLAAAGLWLMAPWLWAQNLDLATRKARAVVVVPERFLRDYDPITVFFPKDRGPVNGGAVDDPARWVQLTPNHPVAAHWVDARTLQLKPVTPWPALTRFTVAVDSIRHHLDTLLSAPQAITPQPDRGNLEPIAGFTLTFSRPVEPTALARMIALRLRPLPGLAGDPVRTIDGQSLTIKPLPRANPGDPAAYQVMPASPLGYGQAIELRLRLSTAEDLDESLVQYRFQTKPLFRLEQVGAGDRFIPLSKDGVRFPADQALTANGNLVLRFGAEPASVTLADIKNMVRFDPAIQDLTYQVDGRLLRLSFDMEPDRAYRLRLLHTPLRDRDGRSLESFQPAELYVYRPAPASFLRLDRGQLIVERLGPQEIPLAGRGAPRADLRVYEIDPLDPRFWPFPDTPVLVDESTRPAGPGEIKGPRADLAENIRQLGSPLFSRLVDLPLPKRGAHRIGLDLKPILATLDRPQTPGTFLIGLRPLGDQNQRQYARVTVTDLGVTLVEEPDHLLFAITSLASGEPIVGASITAEGIADNPNQTKTLFQLSTDNNGFARYDHQDSMPTTLYRMRITHQNDVLTINPQSPPLLFEEGNWRTSAYGWLRWLRNSPNKMRQATVQKAFIFTERPLYRPEEKVFIKAYLRQKTAGQLRLPANQKRTWLIRGPGDKTWRYPATVNASGSAELIFEEAETPAGSYSVTLLDAMDNPIASRAFRKEAYRIPRFEVQLDAPDKVPLDRPFDIALRAAYYAGGKVIGNPVSWRVTQSPYNFRHQGFPDYTFSSSTRFTRDNDRGDDGLSRNDVTDETGAATLTIDPTLETRVQPTIYTVEATVRGADEQSVSAYRRVIALPPFLLGIRQDRVVNAGQPLEPKLLVLNHAGEPFAGQTLRLRVKHRQWHAYLRETDFTTGDAQYVTDVVDVTVHEQTLTASTEPLSLSIPVTAAGVYLIEVSASDRLGRLQQVTQDVFVRGDSPVAWAKPRNLSVDTVWNQSSYDPGTSAQLIIKSPVQTANALIVVEAPDRNRYHWLPVRNGQAVFNLAVTAAMATKIPVHVLLMQGRTGPGETGRPASYGQRTWLSVNPKAFQLNLDLDHPRTNLPGSDMPMTLAMTDPDGNPLNGEVTLWLVDRAVLALAPEGSLEPVDAFVGSHPSYASLRDTRNQLLGHLPLEPLPGGGGAPEAPFSLKNFESVRRNFKTVPFYTASLNVVNGQAKLTIPLPDNLTEFAVRAVATDGASRFGNGRSVVQIRLPLIVQSALPRFVRPGDQFEAGGVGRVVEGEGGTGVVEIATEGLAVDGPTRRALDWELNQAQNLDFPLTVTAAANPPGDEPSKVRVTMGVSRDADGAADAFDVSLPVISDRSWRTEHDYQTLRLGESIPLPMPTETARANTLKRMAVLTPRNGLVEMLTALNYLDSYPYGCLEQRISATFPDLALEDTLTRVGRQTQTSRLPERFAALHDYLSKCQTNTGLFSYWPGGEGSVELTAYAVEFLLTATHRDLPVNDTLMNNALRALNEALRSDYVHGLDGFRFAERAVALNALAKAGRFDRNYAFELAARARDMDLASEANILATLLDQNLADERLTRDMITDLQNSLILTERDGQAVLEGLQYRQNSWDGPWLASENRTLAEVMRALFRANPAADEPQHILTSLIRNADGQGWGNTRANSAALLAMNDVLAMGEAAPPFQFEVTLAGDTQQVESQGQWLGAFQSTQVGAGRIRLLSAANEPAIDTVNTWLQTHYLPAARGDTVPARQQGFVVERRLLHIDPAGGPSRQRTVEPNQVIAFTAGDVVEDHVRVVNPADRHYVAVRIPLAAGFDPLNPNLATAPPEATPAGRITLTPTYATFADDAITYFYDYLPKGSYDFYFRVRATTRGNFVQPPARAEMMYRQAVQGNSPGCRIHVVAR